MGASCSTSRRDHPEGTFVGLVMVVDGDNLDPEERAALAASLSRGWEQAKTGQTRPAEAILEVLRTRSRARRSSSFPEAEAQIRQVNSWWRESPTVCPLVQSDLRVAS
jgi:hypothetical protein